MAKVACVCENCEKIIYRYPSNIKMYKHHYCSQKCYLTSEERIKRASETKKKLFKEGKIKPTAFWKGKHLSEQHKENIRKGCQGINRYKQPLKMRQNMSKAQLKYFETHSNWWKGKKRPELSKRNRDPIMRAKMLKSLMKKPTGLEQKLIDLIKENNLPFKYVGDGEFILGNRCPDFLNCNGEKQVIEVFGRVFHSPLFTFKKSIPYGQTYKGTMEHYKKYGFNCLILWGVELNNPQRVIEKIKVFSNG